MTILSAQQIAQLAYNAGFRGNDLNTAVAIALAESGGNPSAYNPEAAAGTPQGHGSRGLWQIYGYVHPEYDGNHAFNPQVNAQAAYKIYRQSGGRFTAWSTYNLGWARPKQNYAAMIKDAKNTKIPTQSIPQKSMSNRTQNRSSGNIQSMQVGSGSTEEKSEIIKFLEGFFGGFENGLAIASGLSLMLIAIVFFIWMQLKDGEKSAIIKEVVRSTKG